MTVSHSLTRATLTLLEAVPGAGAALLLGPWLSRLYTPAEWGSSRWCGSAAPIWPWWVCAL